VLTLLNAIVNSLILGSAYAIAGVTFGLLYRIVKVFHFAFAAIGTAGALIAARIVSSLGPSWHSVVIGLAAGMAIAGLLTALCADFVYRPLINRGATSGTTFVSSLALGLIIEAIVVVVGGPESQSFSLTAFTEQTSYSGIRLSGLHVLAVALSVGVAAAAGLFMRGTPVGRQTEALISNPEQAELVGIRTGALSVTLCATLGATSVLGFSLQGMNSSVSLQGGVPLTLFGVLAMLCGGVTSVERTAIAALLIGVVSGISSSLVPGQWASSIVFIAATVLILIRPGAVS
jgi:branched-chain amino acid transport system permease protein